MKIILFAFAMAMLIVSGSFTGCQSPTEKKADAEKDLQEAKEDLREAQQEVVDSMHRAATVEEYEAFKTDAQVRIKRNEDRIAELRVKKAKPGKALDEYYESRITALEKRNAELRDKINSYDRSRSDWGSFKQEFNHDMDELGKAIEDLFTDNKK
jgi:chromosome segregation ATPase